MEVPDRFVELLLEQPEPEQPKKDNKPDANPDAGEGAKAKKEEGKVGKKDAKMKKAKGNKVEMQKKQLDKEVAENAGVLGALREGCELDGVFGSSEPQRGPGRRHWRPHRRQGHADRLRRPRLPRLRPRRRRLR